MFSAICDVQCTLNLWGPHFGGIAWCFFFSIFFLWGMMHYLVDVICLRPLGIISKIAFFIYFLPSLNTAEFLFLLPTNKPLTPKHLQSCYQKRLQHFLISKKFQPLNWADFGLCATPLKFGWICFKSESRYRFLHYLIHQSSKPSCITLFYQWNVHAWKRLTHHNPKCDVPKGNIGRSDNRWNDRFDLEDSFHQNSRRLIKQ